MIDLTHIIEAVIALIVALISTFLIPYLKKKYDAETLAYIKLWVKVGVNAAEQLFQGSGRGEEKLNYVFNFLLDKGIKIDASSLRNMIEAEVLTLDKQLDS